MCYDAETSRNAFVIGIVSSIVLYYSTQKTEYKAIALFLGYVTLMQGFDYLFWTHPPPSDINRVATKAAAVVNWMQPVILFLLLRTTQTKQTTTIKHMVLIYFMIVVCYLTVHWNKLSFTEVKPDSAPSLRWDWIRFKGSNELGILYLIVFIYTSYTFLNSSTNLLFLLLILGTFVFSVSKHYINATYGRFWCYYAAYTPLVLLLALQAKEVGLN